MVTPPRKPRRYRLTPTTPISSCTREDVPTIAEIINQSAQAYKGVIPADR